MHRSIAVAVVAVVFVAAAAFGLPSVAASGVDGHGEEPQVSQTPDNETSDDGLVNSDTTTNTSDDLTDEATETAENTTEETAENTTDTVPNTTEEITETAEKTTEETTETAEKTTEETTETVENATNTVANTTGTTETAEKTTEETTETAENAADTAANTTEETTDTIGDTTEEITETAENTTDTVENATDIVRNATEETTDTAGSTERPAELNASASAEVGNNSVGATVTVNAKMTTVEATVSGDLAKVDASPSENTTTDSIFVDGNASAVSGDDDASEDGDGSESRNDGDTSPLARIPVIPLGGRTGAGVAAVVGGLGLTAVAARSWLVSGASGVGIRAGTGTARAMASLAAERTAGGLRSLLDRLRYFVGLGYSRYDDSDPLEHETRAQINEAVREEPGIHLSAVAKACDAPVSTVRHHLDVLVDENLIYDADLRGRRRYFPAEETDPALRAALADDATAAVVDAIDQLGPASVGDLAREVDRDRSTLSHHLDRLAADGVVKRERDGSTVVNCLSQPAQATLSGATADIETEADDVEHVGEGVYVPSDD